MPLDKSLTLSMPEFSHTHNVLDQILSRKIKLLVELFSSLTLLSLMQVCGIMAEYKRETSVYQIMW